MKRCIFASWFCGHWGRNDITIIKKVLKALKFSLKDYDTTKIKVEINIYTIEEVKE